MIKFFTRFYAKHTESIKFFVAGINMSLAMGFLMGGLALLTGWDHTTVVFNTFGWAIFGLGTTLGVHLIWKVCAFFAPKPKNRFLDR